MTNTTFNECTAPGCNGPMRAAKRILNPRLRRYEWNPVLASDKWAALMHIKSEELEIVGT